MSQTKVKSGLLNFPDQTDFVKLPSGTTAQRPVSPEKGYSRYNTTDNKLEFWNGTIWQQLPGVVAPIITSVSYPGDDLAADPAGGQTITINGSDFITGATVTVGGTTPSVITFVSAAEITFEAPAKAAGDYDIVVTNTDGGNATSVNGMAYNGVPSWTTPAGNLGSFEENTTIPTITLVAAEPDSGLISYSITTGGLPAGLTLTGVDIDGTTPAVAGDTTYNFSVTATDNENQSTERAFNIIVYKFVPSFNTVLYDGNGGTQSITGVGFQPDLVWIKNRDDTNPQALFDSVRGAGKLLSSQSTAAETGNAGDLLGSFDNDGFQVNRNYLASTGYDTTNGAASPLSYVAWCWRAAGYANTFNVLENSNTTSSATASGVGITAGSLITNWSVSANRDSGFSIVRFQPSSVFASIGTVGHGLNSPPKIIIIKSYDPALADSDLMPWMVYSEENGADWEMQFNTSNGKNTDYQRWERTSPTSSVFTIGRSFSQYQTYSGSFNIAYCFAEVAGFSKFGSYTGNGVARTIALDFTPAFVMIKRTGATGSWQIFDNKRSTYRLIPNSNSQEQQSAGTNDEVTLVANGFTLPTDGGNGNNSALAGNTYIYMAFANQF